MNKITCGLLGLATFVLMSADVSSAKAQGVHIRAGGVHLDIGRPHIRRYYRPAVPVVRYTRPG